MYKEYLLLKNQGYDVNVIYAVRDKWANITPLNKDFILVAGKHGSLTHLFSRVFHKFIRHFLAYEFSYHRSSWLMLLKASRIKADLYIGHDLTSLPIVVRAAKRHKAKCGFDAEDFHRNEVSDDINSSFYKASKTIENKYLPQIDYLTCASPLIADAYQKLYPQLRAQTINNVFSKSYIIENESLRLPNEKLKLFWFSQTVGEGRGLETVIEAMGLLQPLNIELTILGAANKEIQKIFNTLACTNNLSLSQIIYLDTVSPNQIFEIAALHHIGLALEISKPYNRDICLTNKIFTYINAGLAIIASETKAQKKLLQENKNIGLLFQIGNVVELANQLKIYYEHPYLLDQHRRAAKKLAKDKFNWEKESQTLLSLIKTTMEN
ncbi:glycosyltransferase family protein [Pedobacter chitinilyticus]|uniref:glycosyltransferase family protein n=1 Tax=Pedobacter chitinilyticus TaxID=2233776 RepID=UPI00196967B5|nr:glycosyltransferase [Pedobacter chitinilyticus]